MAGAFIMVPFLLGIAVAFYFIVSRKENPPASTYFDTSRDKEPVTYLPAVPAQTVYDHQEMGL